MGEGGAGSEISENSEDERWNSLAVLACLFSVLNGEAFPLIVFGWKNGFNERHAA